MSLLTDENQYVVVTRDGQAAPLLPVPQDPVMLIDALEMGSEVSIGAAADVVIRQPNTAPLVVVFSFLVIDAPPGLSPGINLFPASPRTRGRPIGLVVYSNRTAQQIFPYIPNPEAFRTTALALAPAIDIEAVRFNLLDGTAIARISGTDFSLIPQSTSLVRRLNPGEILRPTITVNPGLTLDYSAADNGDELRTLILISP